MTTASASCAPVVTMICDAGSYSRPLSCRNFSAIASRSAGRPAGLV